MSARRRRRQRHLLIPKSNYLALEMSQKWFRTHQILCFIARIIIDSICILRSWMKECELEMSLFVLFLFLWSNRISFFCFRCSVLRENIYEDHLSTESCRCQSSYSAKVVPERRLNCLILPQWNFSHIRRTSSVDFLPFLRFSCLLFFSFVLPAESQN